MLVTEYLELQEQYTKQYGPRTVVLMQVGSFYEIYEYSPTHCLSEAAKIDRSGKTWSQAVGHAVEVSSIINYHLTQENTNEPYSCMNPSKVGFPVIAYEKNRKRLLENDFLIVRLDQAKNGPKVSRIVAEVCSPTTDIAGVPVNRSTSNIACIYIEYQNGTRFDNFLITTGVAILDIITGANTVCEFYSTESDQIYPVQELYRFLISQAPREVLIHITDMPKGLDAPGQTNPYVKYLQKVLELERFERVKVCVNEVPTDYTKIAYQIEFLNKIFNPSSKKIGMMVVQSRNQRIIEELGLERMNYGRVAYMLLMQHCYSHNQHLIAKLSKPDLQWLNQDKHLILAHNAIVQLDVTKHTQNSKTIDSLAAVLDHNRTHLGRRLLYSLLQNPMKAPQDIQAYYDGVQNMLECKIADEPLWLVLDASLKELPDIGRLQRKLEIKILTPKELSVLYNAYTKVINIYITILNTQAPHLQSQLFQQDTITNFNAFMAKYGAIFDFSALECCKIDTSESGTKWLEFVNCPIREGLYADLDENVRTLKTSETALQAIVDHLNSFIEDLRGKKIEFKTQKKTQGAKKHDPSSILLVTTNAKAGALLASAVDTSIAGVLQSITYTTTEKIITSERITSLTTHINMLRAWLRERLLLIYECLIDDIVANFTFFESLASVVARIDVLHSYAKAASMYNYYKPEIVQTTQASFFEARDLRHPIIERLIEDAYIQNDVALGKNVCDVPKNSCDVPKNSCDVPKNSSDVSSNGMLLFGLNMAGKSSLAKAIALNVIMAQAGCYTASKLRYAPYAKIITRISDNDNIFKGQSSFAVEMTELRTILRQADEHTLVVGDELSKGTETHSGMAITVSTILWLIRSGATFIFATHMHDLFKLEVMNSIVAADMRVCHLSVIYDEALKTLVYERKLQPGSGSSVYGLTVAKYLNLPDAFIETANTVLLEITGQNKHFVEPRTSRYNAAVYVDVCAQCGKTAAQTQLHTHHIQEQHKAVNGLIQSMHKNVRNNLIVLCVDCHTALHKQGLELEVVTTASSTVVRTTK